MPERLGFGIAEILPHKKNTEELPLSKSEIFEVYRRYLYPQVHKVLV